MQEHIIGDEVKSIIIIIIIMLIIIIILIIIPLSLINVITKKQENEDMYIYNKNNC
jgi:hypothetical protein